MCLKHFHGGELPVVVEGAGWSCFLLSGDESESQSRSHPLRVEEWHWTHLKCETEWNKFNLSALKNTTIFKKIKVDGINHLY